MDAFSLLRSSEFIGAKELRLRLDEVLREKGHPYRVMVRNKPAAVIIPEERFLELLQIVEDLRDSGLLAKARKRAAALRKKKHAWFWSQSWQRAEREVDADVKAGRVKRFASVEAAFKHLNK